MRYLFIFALLFSCFFARTQSNYFGKKRIVSVHSSYLTDNLGNGNKISYLPTNINFLFSICEQFYAGLYYGSFSQRINNFINTSHEVFHKGGIMLRYKEPFFDERASFNMDVSFGYSNYSLNPNDGDDFISYNNYQAGINCLVDFRIYKPLFISGGFIGQRTLKKGDYGFELWPMLGLSLQF